MSKKLLVIGLVVLFAIGTLFAVGCGGDDEAAQQTMRDALTVVEADIAQMTTAFSSGQATGADLKAAIAEVEPHWLAVIAASENVKEADATKAQQVWDDVKAAVEALPDDAGLAEMAAVLVPVQALQAYVQELRALVGTGEEATTTTAAE